MEGGDKLSTCLLQACADPALGLSNLLAIAQVPTKGLLNTIGAPQLGDHSPYLALNTSVLGLQGSSAIAGGTLSATRKLLWVGCLAFLC